MDLLRPGWEFIRAGGPVMPPLIGLSLWLWTLIILKAVWLWRVRRDQSAAAEVHAYLSGQASPPAASGPQGWALDAFMTVRTHRAAVDSRLWEAVVRRQWPLMWRYVGTILVLAGAAPLLGLLGTVSGMIGAFDAIEAFGTGNPQAMALGIREALITTQTGLLVAIPGLFAGYLLKRLVGREQNKLFSFQQAVDRWIRTKEA